jgi:hypothetical protein
MSQSANINDKTMKRMMIIIMIICVQKLNAQTWNEWFAQKKTQIKYLVEQIVALQTYTGYLKKGYDIVYNGTNMINDIKNGDFSLHEDHFDSLKVVNSSVKNLSEVEGVVAFQNIIIKQFQNCIKTCKASNAFSDDDLEYLNRVYDNLTTECLKDVSALELVVSDDSLEMNDNERLRRVNEIYRATQNKYQFAMSFTNEAIALSASRTRELEDINVLKGLFDEK